MGVGAGRQSGGFWEEETWGVAQRLSSPTPCPGRCLPAPRPRRPRGPRALRAQDQAADPEAAAARAEDALPAARRPPAAVGPRPAPRPGAAARRLRQGRRRRQEGQDEEEAVREVTPPLGPPAWARRGHQSAGVPCVPLCARAGPSGRLQEPLSVRKNLYDTQGAAARDVRAGSRRVRRSWPPGPGRPRLAWQLAPAALLCSGFRGGGHSV